MRSSDIERLYSRDYFLQDCEGFDTFLKQAGHPHGGRKVSRRLSKCVALVGAAEGTRVVDIGCGRGEIATRLASQGATVVAVDPSEAALGLVRQSEPPAGVLSVRALGEELPIRTGWADAIVLSDVVEHLDRPRLRLLLQDSARVLRLDGRAVIHTQPNRLLVDIAVPILSRLSGLWGVALPRDLRSEAAPGSGPEYHRNELSARTLRRAVRAAGLVVDELWLEGTWAIHRVFGSGRLKEFVLRRFRRSPALKYLLATQVYCVARKAEAPTEAPDSRKQDSRES